MNILYKKGNVKIPVIIIIWIIFSFIHVSCQRFVGIEVITEANVTNDNLYLSSLPRYCDLPTQNLWYCRSIECMHSFSSSHRFCHSQQIIMAGITFDIKSDYMFPYFIPWILHMFGNHVNYDVTIFIMDYVDYGQDAGSMVINELVKSMPSCTSFLLFHCHALSISFHPHNLVEYRKHLGFKRHVLIHLSYEVAYHIEQDIPTHICYGNESSMLSYYQTYDLVVKQYYYELLHPYSLYLPLGPQDYHQLAAHRKRYGVHPINLRTHLCTFSGRFYYQTHTPEHIQREEIKQLMDSSRFPCMVISSSDNVLGTPQLSHDHYMKVMADTIFIPCPAGSAPETFRLYEALELGAIPIMVRARSMVDFLSEWRGYPGPIIASWTSLEEYFMFLGTVDDHDMNICVRYGRYCDTGDYRGFLVAEQELVTRHQDMTRLHVYLNYLQGRIMTWYFGYKANVSYDIISKVHNELHN